MASAPTASLHTAAHTGLLAERNAGEANEKNHDFTAAVFKRRTEPITKVAPLCAMRPTSGSNCSAPSVIQGSIGARNTPASTPCSRKRRTVSSRGSGAGDIGSKLRHTDLSSVFTLTFTVQPGIFRSRSTSRKTRGNGL